MASDSETKNYKFFYSSGATKVTGPIGKKEYKEIADKIRSEDPNFQVSEIK